jgi:hypothetical protein
MATVFFAHDPRVERDVAVKVLLRELLTAPQIRERFKREARVIAGLDHPAIVPVYDFGEDEGDPFIVMRHMAGGSLSDRIGRGALPLSEAAVIVDRISQGLDRAHEQGIIHRDLKPGNVLFDQYGSAYLSDFGIVKVVQEASSLTGTGAFFGTPHYMSPEQVVGDLELDGRSDVYALGVILYEMLAGKTPFNADTPLALAFKHVYEQAPRILDDLPNLPPEVEVIMDKALAKDRDERYTTAGEFSADLLKVAQVDLTDLVRSTGSIKRAAIPPGPPTPILVRSEDAEKRDDPKGKKEKKRKKEKTREKPARRKGMPIWVLGLAALALAAVYGVFKYGQGATIPGIIVPQPAPTNTAEAFVVVEEPTPTEVVVAAVPAATGGMIAFVAGQDPASYDLFVMQSDGSGRTRLTFNAESNRGPAWSPDGTHIAYRAAAANGNRVIFVINADGSDPVALTEAASDNYFPAWSPDGSEMVFVSERDGNPELYVMNADGSAAQRITENTARDFQPTWSADGTEILYYSDQDGRQDIYVINADGSNQRRLTSDPANDYQAVWSPDGTQIVFVSERNGNAELYLMSADGTEHTRITTNTAADTSPTWSPDGETIVFVSRRDGNSEVYSIRPNGAGEKRLTENEDSDLDPAWQP